MQDRNPKPPIDRSAAAPDTPRDASVSPSLLAAGDDSFRAYELKFLVSPESAEKIKAWAKAHMQIDLHADPAMGGAYETTTLYLDTPSFDILRRTEKTGGRKFRIRRYGDTERLFIEEKARRRDRVRKRRATMPIAELERLASPEFDHRHPADWFHALIAEFSLSPTALITYRRHAYFGDTGGSPIRLTLDTEICGREASAWRIERKNDGVRVLEDSVICEFKFADTLPVIFKDLIAELALQPSSVSKYRRVMRQIGRLPVEDERDA
jgi:hypothetical protein